jgi:hypothetical protein
MREHEMINIQDTQQGHEKINKLNFSFSPIYLDRFTVRNIHRGCISSSSTLRQTSPKGTVGDSVCDVSHARSDEMCHDIWAKDERTNCYFVEPSW